MRDHELKAAIREKERAWANLARLHAGRLAWECERGNGEVLAELERGCDEAEARHEDARSRYLRLALGRRL